MKFLIGCYNIFRVTAQLWQPSEWKNYDLEFIFPCNFQNKNDFPALPDTMITQLKWKIILLVWIFPKQFITRTVLFFKNPAAKSPLLCLFTSVSERSLTPAPSKFTQENWFWNWFSKTMGEVDLDFNRAISLGKLIFVMKNPTCNRISIAPTASSMLNLSRGSEDCLAFFFCRDLDYWQF